MKKAVYAKIALLFPLALPVFAGDLDRFLDPALNYTSRNEACLALRGSAAPDAIAAMRASIVNTQLQTCAAANLRLAGASRELLSALRESEPSVRAVAARELGALQDPEFVPALRDAADDMDVLVASNAIEALVRYEDHSTAPQLRDIALKTGVLSTLALNALIGWNDPEVLPIARKLIVRKDPGDQLAAIRAIGMTGDATDLPLLRELSKDEANLAAGGRGFGLMPAISISRAARLAMESIGKRS